MADYKFTQTGAEIQALLNKAAGFASTGIYKHELQITKNDGAVVIVIINNSADEITTSSQLNTAKNSCISMFWKNYAVQQPILRLEVYGGTGIYEAYIKIWEIDVSNDSIVKTTYSDTSLYNVTSYPDTVTRLF